MTLNSEDREWARDQIERYAADYPDYERYARLLTKIFAQAGKVYAPLAIVQARPKSISSFGEKIWRKRAKYANPVDQLTDLAGGRIITHTADEVAVVSKFIEQHFVIDWDNSVGVMDRLKPTEFGYRSVHYVVTLRPGSFPTPDVAVELPAEGDRVYELKAEIQVRTLLEHAYADIAHDLVYKSGLPVPDKWQRELAAVAAALETADGSFGRVVQGLRAFATSYASYMKDEEMRVAIARLGVVRDALSALACRAERNGGDEFREHEEDAVLLASEIGKLALELGDPRQAAEALERWAPVKENIEQTTLPSSRRPILRDLGIALCSANDPGSAEWEIGQLYLAKASPETDPDVRALAARAEAWAQIDDEEARAEARRFYRRAFNADPSNPYVLGGYLEREIAGNRERIAVARSVRSVITDAIRRCRDQVEVGVNLDRAFHEMGKLHLLRALSKDPYDALAAYAKGVDAKESSSADIRAAQESLERLEKTGLDIAGCDWAQKLLMIGLVVKLDRELKEATAEIERSTSERETAIRELRAFASGGERLLSPPVVIVAGGTDPSVEEKMQGYRELLTFAFKDFKGREHGTKGTVICGGTRQGISGLVGELGEGSTTIHTLAYLPQRPGDDRLADDATIDDRYSDIRRTQNKTFSPLEPLQSWIDILARGIDPRDVKLLGINGGLIAAAEFRIALALGARVAIVEGSGREAAKILPDDDWGTSERLAPLPPDPETVRAFIRLGEPRLAPEPREKVARAIHEAYVADAQEAGRRQWNDPAMAPWEDLNDDFRESNLNQADNIPVMLEAVDCEVCEAADSTVKFTDGDIETMAEIEHGRWNVERLLGGWRLGERDPDEKKSPYLVGWSVLPEEVKQWDRDTVARILEYLGAADLKVRRR